MRREKGKASKTPKAKGHVAFIAVLAMKAISDALGFAVFPATVMVPTGIDSGLAVYRRSNVTCWPTDPNKGHHSTYDALI